MLQRKSNKTISERAVAAEGNSDKFLTRDHLRSGCRQTKKNTGNRKEAGFLLFEFTIHLCIYVIYLIKDNRRTSLI